MVLTERRKASLFIIMLALVLTGIVLSAGAPPSPFSHKKITDTNDIPAFLGSFNWSCDVLQCTEQKTVLPQQFDDTFIAYNAIQLQQGCDLTKYAGKEVTVYTLPVTNYPDYGGNVLATIIVYRGKVIGGDIHAAAMDGFMHGFKK